MENIEQYDLIMHNVNTQLPSADDAVEPRPQFRNSKSGNVEQPLPEHYIPTTQLDDIGPPPTDEEGGYRYDGLLTLLISTRADTLQTNVV